MGEDGMNKEQTVEEFIIDLLEQEHGKLREAVSYDLRHKNLCGSIEGMAEAHAAFVNNPSFVNWNIMITAMATYQWWMQKKVE